MLPARKSSWNSYWASFWRPMAKIKWLSAAIGGWRHASAWRCHVCWGACPMARPLTRSTCSSSRKCWPGWIASNINGRNSLTIATLTALLLAGGAATAAETPTAPADKAAVAAILQSYADDYRSDPALAEVSFGIEVEGDWWSVTAKPGEGDGPGQVTLKEGAPGTPTFYFTLDRETLGKLEERGFKMSIDDFGTGYSSLSYLKHLPATTLKVDRSFVREIATSSHNRAIVEAVVTMAHNLNLTVVAEGVETAEEFRVIHALGCDEIQGYLFSKPLDREDALAILGADARATFKSWLADGVADEPVSAAG